MNDTCPRVGLSRAGSGLETFSSQLFFCISPHGLIARDVTSTSRIIGQNGGETGGESRRRRLAGYVT